MPLTTKESNHVVFLVPRGVGMAVRSWLGISLSFFVACCQIIIRSRHFNTILRTQNDNNSNNKLQRQKNCLREANKCSSPERTAQGNALVTVPAARDIAHLTLSTEKHHRILVLIYFLLSCLIRHIDNNQQTEFLP